jgi:hypothetical protein
MRKDFSMLSKELMESEDYFLERFTRMQAYIDLCLLAEWKERKFLKRGIVVELKPGQLAKSEDELAARWKWSRNTVRKFLFEQQMVGNIEQQKSRLITVITVKFGLMVAQQNEQQNGTKVEQQNGQLTIDSNINNNKKEDDTNVSPKKKKKVFVPPTLDEVAAYIKEKGFHFNAKEFIDYYEADDWHYGKKRQKVTNWKRCCLTWEKNRKNDYPSLFGQETDVTNDQGETMVIPPEWNVVGEDGRHYETIYDMTRQQNSYEEYFEQYGNYK